MSEWKEIRLGDLISVEHGFAFKGDDFSEKNLNGPIVVTIGNFDYSGGFRFGSTKLKRCVSEYPEKYKLKAGEILLAMTCQTSGGEILGIPGVIPDNKEIYLHNQRLGKVVLKSTNVYLKYLYWLFLSRDFNNHLCLTATGTKILHTAPKRIESYTFNCPPLPEQKAIAHILGSLDDKIELNRKMNETLEGMAQALFKSWFSDFDPVIDNILRRNLDQNQLSPDHAAEEDSTFEGIPEEFRERAEVRLKTLGERSSRCVASRKDGAGAPSLPDSSTLPNIGNLFPSAFRESEELGWIPEGWEVRAIGDCFQLFGGHSFKSGDYVEGGQFGIVTIKNVQDGSFVQDCTNRITEIPAKMKSHCRLNSGDVLLSLTGNVGRVCIVSEGDYLLNQRVSKIVGRDGIPQAFGYFFFRQESFYEQMITIAKGTAQQNLSPIETAKLEQVMPCNQTIAKLGEHFIAFQTAMVGNTSQNQTLTKLRDTLIPKLISGELSISEAEQLTERALV